MQKQLSISIGQCSKAGRKEINQDFHGTLIPCGPALALKGISVLVTDGISSSTVSQIAAESAVKSFLTDYYCTSDTWSVKTSALRVIRAANSWLYAETKRNIDAYNMDSGYVCTFSALVLKSHAAHIFHVGDSRIYRMEGGALEQLTQDHRTVVSSVQSYLARAMGMAESVDIDYRRVAISEGDVFILATDGVFEHCTAQDMSHALKAAQGDFDAAAEKIVQRAYENGSHDNLTIQIVRIDSLPPRDVTDTIGLSRTLPVPPLLEAGQGFEGYTVLRPLHANHRSHIYLVEDSETGQRAALKIPSMALRDDGPYLQHFMMEDWIAKRINSAHVVKAFPHSRRQNYIYTVSEYIEGQTLAQWIIDNPACELEAMRGIIEQIATGLRALHRKEMIHQDLRPENIMITADGTVKIIDFGAASIAGVSEAMPMHDIEGLKGALQYAAPEYFIGGPVSKSADYYALGVIAYQMLTGRLPYGTQVAKLRTPAQLKSLKYISARQQNSHIPDWLDGALKKAVNPAPHLRYAALSEFVADIRTPNKAFSAARNRPLAERNPVAFWKGISAFLAVIVVVLLSRLNQ